MGSRSLPRAALSALILLSCALFAEIALTEDSLDPMEKCFSVSDSVARLACFDGEMRQRHAQAQSKSAATVATPPPAPAPPASPAVSVTTVRKSAADDTVGLDGRQLMLKRKAENIPSDAPQPMVVKLIRLTQRPGHQYYFELENGQLWESTDATADLFLGPHETVTIRPGIMGAFFLRTREGNSIRVHRLR